MGISSNKGFTLLEVLIALSILILILSSIPPLLGTMTQNTETESLSIRQALHFISMEVHKGNVVSIEENKLFIEDQQGRLAVFEQYKDMIRRRVNGKGHEIYLHHIENLEFHLDGSIITAIVRGKEGRLYEKRIITE
ncbi:competence protein ComGF [Terribacillus halophilus]|uniref:Competence protein ComGF n=1 Tax=Terribacillus halophilus TaxID=361279 RepID=A0A1G6VJY3_9BACI|nr:competence protein ComGF [Terribacillus halophilus]